MPSLETGSETHVVASLMATTTTTAAQQAADETKTIEVSFTPSRAAMGLSREVFGTVSLTETCYGEIAHVDGTRVQHIHDRRLYRLIEELVTELRELRNSEKGA